MNPPADRSKPRMLQLPRDTNYGTPSAAIGRVAKSPAAR
jgi:hypothetical protein